MTLLELNPELERFRGWLELKNERLRTLRSAVLFAALAPRLIARQSSLHDAVKHLDHFLLGALACNLQQQRLGKNSLLDALLAERIRNIPQRQRFGHRRARSTDLLGDILMRGFKVRAQAMQSIRFF